MPTRYVCRDCRREWVYTTTAEGNCPACGSSAVETVTFTPLMIGLDSTTQPADLPCAVEDIPHGTDPPNEPAPQPSVTPPPLALVQQPLLTTEPPPLAQQPAYTQDLGERL